MIIRVQGAEEIKNHIYYQYDSDSIPLGSGGMGVVYEGMCYSEDNAEESVPVAIKLITNPTNNLIERAMREASVQIDSPNLLRMYGFIPNKELDPVTQTIVIKYYLVMERLVGVSLEDLINGVVIDRSGATIDFAKELYKLYISNRKKFIYTVISKILSGLLELHKAGFVHRDVDPSNVMITHDGNIKLIDYGICKPVSYFFYQSHKLTNYGALLGKIEYAAPEIITGDISHHNFSTDVYSVGIMMFQLCTGRLPFNGNNSEVMRAQLTQEVPLKKIIDRHFRCVIGKATQKSQSNRYQSAEEMIYDLHNSNNGGSVSFFKWALFVLVGIVVGVIFAYLLSVL